MKLRNVVIVLLGSCFAAGSVSCSKEPKPAPPASPAPAGPAVNERKQPDPGQSVIDEARDENRIAVPTISLDDLAARIKNKKKTYVVELKSKDADPLISGAEVIRPEMVDAWASNLPRSAYVVAYCT